MWGVHQLNKFKKQEIKPLYCNENTKICNRALAHIEYYFECIEDNFRIYAFHCQLMQNGNVVVAHVVLLSLCTHKRNNSIITKCSQVVRQGKCSCGVMVA